MSPLEMRGECARCGSLLGLEANAYICSYECTFCPDCNAELDSACPNCSGPLERRPRRTPVDEPA